MTRRYIRYFLCVCLFASVAFAAWAWFRPYAWQPDPQARCRISETLVTRDGSYFWLHVHLTMNPGMTHDPEKPVRLETATGATLEPADTTFAGTDPLKATEMWFKFWVESAALDGPINLRIDDGRLSVKATSGLPSVQQSGYRNYTTNQWNLWFGF